MVETERAPAKINLYLHVLGRRDDGYHRLDSLVAFADIADEIEATPAPALSLAIEGPFAAALRGNPDANLVRQAAERLAQRIGGAPGAALRLVKNLPVSSGIGGGSSDAAATLRLLARLWRGRLDASALHEIAASLGADVPVCLAPRASWLGGIGEEVEAAPPLPTIAVVLANPRIALPTADVFKRRTGPFSQPARFAQAQDAATLAALIAERRNDLAEAARALVPEIGDVLARLAATSGALVARMSGSGATCFALYAAADDAARAADRLRRENATWWVRAGTLA